MLKIHIFPLDFDEKRGLPEDPRGDPLEAHMLKIHIFGCEIDENKNTKSLIFKSIYKTKLIFNIYKPVLARNGKRV